MDGERLAASKALTSLRVPGNNPFFKHRGCGCSPPIVHAMLVRPRHGRTQPSRIRSPEVVKEIYRRDRDILIATWAWFAFDQAPQDMSRLLVPRVVTVAGRTGQNTILTLCDTNG